MSPRVGQVEHEISPIAPKLFLSFSAPDNMQKIFSKSFFSSHSASKITSKIVIPEKNLHLAYPTLDIGKLIEDFDIKHSP